MAVHPDDITIRKIEEIRMNGGTQVRVKLNQEVIDDYAEAWQAGAKFPPVHLFYDGMNYWLADGFHRVKGAIQAGLTEIEAIVRQGTVRHAILYSVRANDKHGLRRTNADKRNAMMTLLRDEEWGGKSSNWISKQCGVHRSTVDELKARMDATCGFRKLGATLGADGKFRKPRTSEPRSSNGTPKTPVGTGSRPSASNGSSAAILDKPADESPSDVGDAEPSAPSELEPEPAPVVREVTITLPLDPNAAAEVIRRHFQGDSLVALIRALEAGRG